MRRRIGFMGLAWALGLAALLGLLPAAQAQVGTWATAGELTDGRVAHTATLLNNGDVLVVAVEYRLRAGGKPHAHHQGNSGGDPGRHLSIAL